MKDLDWKVIIKEVQDHQNLNQAELSRKTDISTVHIHGLKTGKRKEPSFTKGWAILRLHPNKEEYLK